jgi:carbamoyltransferase
VSERLFDLEHLDADRLRRIADRLRTLGYTEDGVRERLGLEDISAIDLDAYPYYINERLRRRDRLDLSILLLLLQGVVAVEELNTLFDKDDRLLLKSAGILLAEKSTRTYRAAASLYPLRDRLFFTDHRWKHMPWIRSRAPRDPVMYLGPEAYSLARATIRRRSRAVLDLCTGSGVHAVLAAAHADRIVGIDSSPRACNFAKLNAILNDAWNALFLEGDLFRPLGGERFDLILANPPFVPSPVYELRYRDGGPSGADVLRRIIASVPDYLSAGGLAQIVTHLGEREGESYLDRIRRWLNGANMNIHALKVGEDSVEDYSILQARPAFGEDYAKYATGLKSWVDNMKAQRFSRVVNLVLTFEWNEEGTNPPWSREDEAKPPKRAIGQDLARILQAKKRSRAANALRALDRCRVGVPDDMVLVERRRPTGSGFETKDFRVTWKDPALAPELEIKPLVRDLLERVDNRATVPEIIARYARDTKAPIDEVDERCRRAFLAMLERGLVTLDEVEVKAAPSAEHALAKAVEDELISAPQTRPASSSSVRPFDGTPRPEPTAAELMAISSNEIDDPEAERKLAEVDGALAALAAETTDEPEFAGDAGDDLDAPLPEATARDKPDALAPAGENAPAVSPGAPAGPGEAPASEIK